MGLILGPLVDQNLRRALLIYQYQDFSALALRPVGLILVLVIAATILGSLMGSGRARRLRSRATQ
jgi:TctA family transporter